MITSCCPDKGVVCVRMKTHSNCCVSNAGDSPFSTTKEQEGVKVGGWTKTSIPKIPFPAPNRNKNLIFMDHQKKEPPNSMVPKVAETTPTVALKGVLLSQGGVCGSLQFLCSQRLLVVAVLQTFQPTAPLPMFVSLFLAVHMHVTCLYGIPMSYTSVSYTSKCHASMPHKHGLRSVWFHVILFRVSRHLAFSLHCLYGVRVVSALRAWVGLGGDSMCRFAVV